LLACTAAVLFFLAFTTYYIFNALKLQTGHRIKMMQQFANIEQRSLDWLRKVLLLFSIAWFLLGLKQVLWLSGISAPVFYVSLASIETLAIASFAYFGLRQPTLGLEHDDAEASKRIPILTETHMARLAAKLALALDTNRLYAESNLSLRDLCDITGATKNHISETLSQYLEVNFFDFVNMRRIEEAERLLFETDETVLTIGLEVGFNSRSTFNAAFLKHSGSAPSAYRSKERAEKLTAFQGNMASMPEVSE
jgi:AraC-like DNA-binding protein